MLVYSTILWLDKSTKTDEVIGVAARWLGKKTKSYVTSEMLKSSGERRMPDGSHLETVALVDTFPILTGLRFTHRDSEVSGRQWVTEIGVRQQAEGTEIECSVLLKTNEISARVSSPVQPTRPMVVPDMVKHCRASPRTCGLSVKTLNEETVEDFRYLVDDDRRRHPLAVISPTASGLYLVNPERVRDLVVGVADVFAIPPDADTFLIARVLGNQYAAYRGAVNLIYPEVRGRGQQFIPTRRILPEELDQLASSGTVPESEVFSLITHRTNIPNSWRHISLEFVREALLLRKLSRKREEASETVKLSEYVKLLEESNKDYEQKIQALNNEVSSWQELSDQIDEENKKLKYENENIKAALERSGQYHAEPSSIDLSEQVRDALSACMTHSASPEQVLRAVSATFPDRVAVLPTAWKSSRESGKFKGGKKILELIWKLVTEYWEALNSGKGDAVARQIFGNSYSPRESETVENNPKARKLRTFQYRDREIVMMRHLKIGVKDSAAETIRIHFEWVPTEARIVIGHCGPHLDHR